MPTRHRNKVPVGCQVQFRQVKLNHDTVFLFLSLAPVLLPLAQGMMGRWAMERPAGRWSVPRKGDRRRMGRKKGESAATEGGEGGEEGVDAYEYCRDGQGRAWVAPVAMATPAVSWRTTPGLSRPIHLSSSVRLYRSTRRPTLQRPTVNPLGPIFPLSTPSAQRNDDRSRARDRCWALDTIRKSRRDRELETREEQEASQARDWITRLSSIVRLRMVCRWAGLRYEGEEGKRKFSRSRLIKIIDFVRGRRKETMCDAECSRVN